MTVRILTVCTGNICRSALAEYQLRDLLPEFDISSAGTHAVVGWEVPEQQVRIAQAHGLDAITDHQPRQVTAAMLQEADVILALTMEHRRQLARLSPISARKLFTLREFAALTAAVTEEDLQAARDDMVEDVATSAAASLRGVVPTPEDPAEWDVIDPFRQSDEVYQESADQLLPAARQIAEYYRRNANS